MVRKIILTKEEKEFIKYHYSAGELSITDISKELGYDRGVVKRAAKEMNLEKVHPKGNRGVKYIWTKEKDNLLMKLYSSTDVTVLDIAEELGTSEDTVTKRARKLGVKKKKKTILDKEDLSYIKDRAASISIARIANHLSVSEELVRKKVHELNLTNLYYDNKKEEWKVKKAEKKRKIEEFYSKRKRPGFAPIDDDVFLWDLSNPYYTTFDLGMKYDLHPSTIGNWRKRLVGEIYASPKNSDTMTELEYLVSEILENEFDLAYFFQHKIGKWSVDFYLGSKKIIEAQGSKWHSSEKVKDKDKRKLKELIDLGYSVLYIHEKDVYKKEDYVKEKIMGFLQQ